MADPERYGVQRLEIYKISHALAVRIHVMTLKLPRFEQFEEAQQVRRSSKSVSALIVEGHAMRKYRDKYLYYLNQALGSSDESLEHLMFLYECGSLADPKEYSQLEAECKRLSAKLGRFIIGVERCHTRPYYLE